MTLVRQHKPVILSGGCKNHQKRCTPIRGVQGDSKDNKPNNTVGNMNERNKTMGVQNSAKDNKPNKTVGNVNERNKMMGH